MMSYYAPYAGFGGVAIRLKQFVRATSVVITDSTAPEPVTLAEFKLHRRDNPENIEDALSTELIATARVGLDDYTGRALKPLVITAYYPWFGCGLELPMPPLTSVTEIKYQDSDNVEQILNTSDYTVNDTTTPGVVIPAFNTTFPSTSSYNLPVAVTAQVGYQAGEIPTPLKQAILLLSGHLYENREYTSTMNIRDVPVSRQLADAYRIPRV